MGKILENLYLVVLIGVVIAVGLMMAPYYAPATIAIGSKSFRVSYGSFV